MADSNNGNHNESSRILNMTNGLSGRSRKCASTDLHKTTGETIGPQNDVRLAFLDFEQPRLSAKPKVSHHGPDMGVENCPLPAS